MQRILIAADGSEQSLAAVNWVASAYSPQSAEVVVAATYALDRNALMAGYIPPPDWAERWTAELTDHLTSDWTAPLREKGFSPRVVVREGRAEETLLEIAREEKADLVVAGCRGRGSVREMFLGSVSHFLVLHAPCPVVVIPPAMAAHERENSVLKAAS